MTARRGWAVGAATLAAIAVGAVVWSQAARVDDAPPSPAASGSAAAAPPAARPALTITVATPRVERWPLELVANGSVAAWQEIVIGSEISGLRLTEVLVNVGDRVKRGQLLARLSDETVQAEREQIRAALGEAQATLAEAKANAERARRLEASGAISAQQIAQYLTVEQTARARVEAQRARLRAEEVRLSNTRVVAPDDGILSARTATMGAVVQPGSELFRLIRDARLEWRAEVNGADLPRVRAGQPVRVSAPDGTTITGRVRIVAPTIDPATRMGLVYVDLPVPGSARAGMFARGEIDLGASDAMTLPQASVVLRDGFRYVFRVDDESRVVQTKIETGRRRGGRIEVLGGLDPNARVADSGVGFLADGDVVRVVPATSIEARAAGGTAK